jgi:hypothetical protein
MRKFKWPDHIQFDDTEDDMRLARHAWSRAQEIEPYGLSVGEFLIFMQQYADEVERRRAMENKTLIVQSA